MSGQEAINKAEKIRQILCETTITKDGQKVCATVSIGVASFPEHGSNVNELIACADNALYKAKDKGRNLVVLADPFDPKEKEPTE